MDKNITFEGSLLIASKSMPDPRFSKSVILLINFSTDGAMGIVLNRPHKIKLKDVLKNMNIDQIGSNANIPIFNGGPVSIDKGFLLHNSDIVLEDSIKIGGANCFLNSSKDDLSNLCMAGINSGVNLYLGCCGWSPGQLENELKSNDWLISKAQTDLLFDNNHSKMWEKAIERIGFDIASFSNDIGIA
tara:strand:+ start:25 stop:588 length:564 start_codon:yes stop_codon:yes gene_type:complete